MYTYSLVLALYLDWLLKQPFSPTSTVNVISLNLVLTGTKNCWSLFHRFFAGRTVNCMSQTQVKNWWTCLLGYVIKYAIRVKCEGWVKVCEIPSSKVRLPSLINWRFIIFFFWKKLTVSYKDKEKQNTVSSSVRKQCGVRKISEQKRMRSRIKNHVCSCSWQSRKTSGFFANKPTTFTIVISLVINRLKRTLRKKVFKESEFLKVKFAFTSWFWETFVHEISRTQRKRS